MKKTYKQTSKSLKILYLLGLLLAISSALPSYIQSSFLEGFVSVSLVGLFFVMANVVGLFSILIFPYWIRKMNNYSVSIIVLLIVFLSLIGLGSATSVASLFIFFIISSASLSLVWINMDLFVESFSRNQSTGKTRTLYFTFLNLGWIISPMITGFLINTNGYNLVYFAAAFMILPFLWILIKNKKLLAKKPDYKKLNLIKTLTSLWKNHNLRGIFVLAFLLQVFYSSAVIFIPLYLHQTIGFDWSTLGLMFSIMLVPFVLLELPAGILADKYWGEKEILTIGFFILILSLVLFYITKSTSPIIWALLLFLSRVGASLVEAMRETYFFKIVDVENLNIINLFRTTGPLGYLFGSALGAIVAWVLPIQYLFLITSMVLLASFYYIHMLKDTR